MQRMVMVCVVRCGEVRRSEKVVRRKKRKRKRKRKKKKRERKKKREKKKEKERKKRKQEKKYLSVVSFGAMFLTHNKVKTNMPSNSFETSFQFTHQKRKSA